MPFSHTAAPPYQSVHFRTSNIEEFKSGALARFGAICGMVSGPAVFEAHGSFIVCGDIAVLSGASNWSVVVNYPEFDFARMSIPLAGRGATTIGKDTVEIDEHQSCITSPGRTSRVRCSENHEWLNLRLRTAALQKKLTSITGVRPDRNLEFVAASNLDDPRTKSLCQLASFFAQQLSLTTVEAPLVVLRELEQAIVTSFLLATRHNFSDSLERDPREGEPWQVRRVEEHIEAHWDQPVSIDVLAEITGTSARSIFRAFQKSRGYTPMEFAKKIRLEHARELLAAADEKASVTGIALRCGFGNLGHFARDYREMFGHRPSESLARSRSRRR